MKQRRTLVACISLILVLCLLAAGCAPKAANAPAAAPAAAAEAAKPAQSTEPAAPEATGEPIKVGAVLPLSSSAGATGTRVRNGIEFSVKQINDAGGVDGRPMEVIFEDIQASDPALAMSAVEKLINQDQVCAIIGCYGSSASLAALPICEKNGVAMIEPIATSPLLTTGSEWVFRITSTNGLDAVMVGPGLPELGFKNVAYMPIDNDWGLAVSKGYVPVLEANGARTVDIVPITIGETNYLSQLTKIKNSGADSIVVAQDIESCATLIRQCVESGMTDFKIVLNGVNSSLMYNLIGEACVGVYFIEYYAEPEMEGTKDAAKGKAFAESFNKMFPDTKADYAVVQGLSATEILRDAILRAGSTDRTAIRDALKETKYEGLRGLIEFDEVGQSHGEVVLTQMQPGGTPRVVGYFGGAN